MGFFKWLTHCFTEAPQRHTEIRKLKAEIRKEVSDRRAEAAAGDPKAHEHLNNFSNTLQAQSMRLLRRAGDAK